jgi:hypothetical protein
MDFSLLEKPSKVSVIRSNAFDVKNKVTCEYYDSKKYTLYSGNHDPVDYAIKNMDLIDECIEMIVPNDQPQNSIVRQILEIEKDLSWSNHEDAKLKISEALKRNWSLIDGIEPEHNIYDENRSEFGLSIVFDTTLEQIKDLDEGVLEKWEYTVYTPYGQIEFHE